MTHLFAGTRPALRTAVHELSERRHARATYRELKRKLATYTTRAEVDDLLAMIEGREDADAEMIRSILSGNLHQQRSVSAFGLATGP